MVGSGTWSELQGGQHGQETAHAGADYHGTERGRSGLASGKTAAMVSRELGISEQTYYRWRKEFGGLRVDQARKLKELERENAHLKRAVANRA